MGWLIGHPLVTTVGTLYSFTMGMSFVTHLGWYLFSALSAGILGLLLYRGILCDRRLGFPATLAVFVPLALAVGLSIFTPFYSERSTRYLSFAQPFLILLFVAGIQSFKSKRGRLAAGGAVLLIFITALYPLYFLWDEVGLGNSEMAARKLTAGVTPRDQIFSTRYAGLPIAYYLPDDQAEQMIFIKEEKISRIQPRSERIWIISINTQSQLKTIMDPEKNRQLEPIWHPPGYRLEFHDTVPGRRPYVLTLFRRGGS